MVTGASGGLGEAIADQLLSRGADLTLVARPGERLEAARARLAAKHTARAVRAIGCDLGLLGDVRALPEQLAAERLDVVVLNAAVISPGRRLTAEGVEETLAVNHLAPYLLGRTLLGRLAPGARVVVLGAVPAVLRHAPVVLDDLAFERGFVPALAYLRTKNMNLMFTQALARRAAHLGVAVNAAYPGLVRTALGRNLKGWLGAAFGVVRPLLSSPTRAADTPAWLAWSSEAAGLSGRFFGRRRELTLAAHVLDVGRQEALWAASAQWVGLEP